MCKRRYKGQDTLEFTAVFPMFMLLLFLIILFATQWHAFHVTAQSALEGASKASNMVRAGFRSAQNSANSEAAFANVKVTNNNDAVNVSDYSIGTFYGVTASGQANQIVPLPDNFAVKSPNTVGFVQNTVWKFQPCDGSCPKYHNN